MPWWSCLLLFLGGVALLLVGLSNNDDVFGLLQKIIGVTMLMVAVLSGQLLPLELAGLGLALWLPRAASFDRS